MISFAALVGSVVLNYHEYNVSAFLESTVTARVELKVLYSMNYEFAIIRPRICFSLKCSFVLG